MPSQHYKRRVLPHFCSDELNSNNIENTKWDANKSGMSLYPVIYLLGNLFKVLGDFYLSIPLSCKTVDKELGDSPIAQ